MKKFVFVFLAISIFILMTLPAMAGPFSDVPANSWAYKAVQDLAAKGLVIGYGDSTFRGERTATRYEMAMVVARMLDAYEKGQNAQDQKIELNATDIATLMKLAEEFKSELASLNVRVAALSITPFLLQITQP
nr:S-layer homology domain-containing protein [Thermodesulfobium narugense]